MNALLVMAAATGWAHAQPRAQAPSSPPTLRVFLDCNQCDGDYVRTQVVFADFVRDRASADVHVLVTTETTGSGGLTWTVAFLGQGRFAAHDHSMRFSTAPTATNDDQRAEFVRTLKLGLVFYAADTPAFEHLGVTFDRETSERTTAAKDPWNYWVFQFGVNGFFNGQESTKSANYSVNASANRTTNAWKYSLNANGNGNRNSFVLDDGSSLVSSTRGWFVNQLLVKSLSEHWSAGGTVQVSESTFSNENRLYRLTPSVEYDVFPYNQSTRRLFTILYGVGVSRYRYESVTIFDRLSETVPEQTARASLQLKQRWGSVSISSNFTQQLNIPSRYALDTQAEASLRLFKGFSLDGFFEYDRLRNQIFLPASGASDSDILLRIRQLATGYSYFGNIGISYTFGSIFNNVVNPRFNGQ